MERVLFIVEGTGERLSCLLNPETLVFQRQSGLRPNARATGMVTGLGLSDDRMIATGGGRTEFELELLFDIAIALELNPAQEGVTAIEDVRDLTRPIWNLAENRRAAEGYAAPPMLRFIWGRAWNILSVVVAASERLENFSPEGVPGRSWLKLRLRRQTDTADIAATPATRPIPVLDPDITAPAAEGGAPDDTWAVDMQTGPDGMPLQRLDQLAGSRYGNPAIWRAIAAYNGIDDPLNLPEGTVLRLPPASGTIAGSSAGAA